MPPLLKRHSLVSKALEIEDREIIALSGAGGKTSLMSQLVRELQLGGPVVTTTTTKIAVPDPSQFSCLLLTREDSQWESRCRNQLQQLRHVTLAHYRFGSNKLKGHEGEEMEALLRRDLAPYVVIEADGARQKPLKAPRQDEPLIPKQSTLVVGLIGWDVLGRELTEPNVHRAEIFRHTLGLKGTHVTVSEEILARWVVHSAGLGKNVPSGARFVVFLNKCDTDHNRDQAIRLASSIVCAAGSPCRHALVASLRHGIFLSIQDSTSCCD